MKPLAAIILACLASCAPRAIVVHPISEQAAVAQGAVNRVSDHTDAVKKRADEVGVDVQGLHDQIGKANSEASRLSEIGKATQRELDANAAAWKAAQARATQLQSTADGLQFDVSELQAAVTTAKAESDKLRTQANASDAAVVKLEKEITDMQPDYNLGKSIRHGVWWIVGISIFLLAAFATLLVLAKGASGALQIAEKAVVP